MIKVYTTHLNSIVTIVITTKFKEVTVTSSTGSRCYRAPVGENKYGSMGSYINNWMKAVEGLKPVVIMD